MHSSSTLATSICSLLQTSAIHDATKLLQNQVSEEQSRIMQLLLSLLTESSGMNGRSGTPMYLTMSAACQANTMIFLGAWHAQNQPLADASWQMFLRVVSGHERSISPMCRSLLKTLLNHQDECALHASRALCQPGAAVICTAVAPSSCTPKYVTASADVELHQHLPPHVNDIGELEACDLRGA